MHIILRQHLHIELTGSEAEGLALQQRLPDLCDQWLTPALERALDRCAPAEGNLSIDRLELDIEPMALADLEQTFPELVAAALEDAIRAQIPLAQRPETNVEDGAARHKTTQQTLEEALIYFLTTGSLPWSFWLPKGTHLEQALLDTWRATITTGEQSRAIRSAILPTLAAETARQRLVRQFSPQFLATLLGLLSPAARTEVDEVVAVLHGASLPSAAIIPVEEQLWQVAFAAVATNTELSARRLVGEIWRALPETVTTSTALRRELEQQWPGVTGSDAGEADVAEAAPPDLPEDRPTTSPQSVVTPGSETTSPDPRESTDTLGVREAVESSGDLEGREPWESLEIGTPEQRRAQDSEQSSNHPEASEGIYVDNAGLVLLHPFLSRLFTVLEIAADDALLQPERALSLLHFLATGQTPAPEYHLVLPKLLCNLPLLTPVATNTSLTEAEMAEANVMLEAVIRHWDVLRNTSPDGLRGTFLLRPGKVSRREDGGWLLQVEANSVDILLDQLPWGISMFQLPWMDHMLWVEWG